MKSTINIYSSSSGKEFKIQPSKLMIVEDISSYLATFTPTTISNFQYVKHGLEISIKIIASELYVDPKKIYGWKYVSIQNDEESSPKYYFVKDIIWRSQNTCQLELLMDCLNSFKENTDYAFNSQTLIQRRHKGRFTYSKQNRVFPFQRGNNFDTSKWYRLSDTFEYTSSTGIRNTLSGRLRVYSASSDGVPTSDATYTEYAFDGITFDSNYIYFKEFRIGVWSTIYTLSRSVVRIGSIQIGKFFCKFNSEYGFYEYLSQIYIWKEFNYFVDGYLETLEINRIIDRMSEDINPILYRSSATEIIDANSVGSKWALVYKNQNVPSPDDLDNPVDCFLVPIEKGIGYLTTSTTTGTIVPADLDENIYYYVNPWNLGFDFAYFINGDNDTSFIGGNYNCKGIVFLKEDSTHIKVYVAVYDNTEGFQRFEQYSVGSIKVPNVASFRYGRNPSTILTYLQTYPYTNYSKIPYEWYSGYDWIWSSGQNTAILSSLSEWNRTDSKLIKIIKLPYIPNDIPVIEGVLQDSALYTLVSFDGINALKLNDLNLTFLNQLDEVNVSPIIDAICQDEILDDYVATMDASIEFESKLFHSEFYLPKYVYDSFSLGLALENVDLNAWNRAYTKINFYATSTINSRFAFEIEDYKCGERGSEDYYNWLVIARNNEATLYNSAYINYIRSGYNFDQKNKNISNAMTWAGFGASLIGTIASSISAVYTGGMAIPLAVGMATTTAMTLANAINTTSRNERDMEQKLNQLKQQSVSVAGSDDIDLLERYNHNSLWYMLYQPSETMKNLIWKTFHYLGYKDNIMAIPTHNNRIYFDYLRCEPHINYYDANMSNDMKEQLELCFRTGVVYLHHFNNSYWDFEMTRENLEKDIYDIITEE